MSRNDGAPVEAGIIDQTQFSLLVTVVVLSAIVPTAIAQRQFSPDIEAEKEADIARSDASSAHPAARSTADRVAHHAHCPVIVVR